MSSKLAVRVNGISKNYQIYNKPHHRLLQFFYRNRRKFFSDHWALRDISFSVYEGETLGIIGTNGSGKSTLLQIISGTLNPTAGQVATSGRVAALLELGAGFNPEFTGLENIRLSGSLYGLSEQEIEEKLQSIIDFSGIGEQVGREVKTYSSGMFVRLAFSVVAHLDPKILIVDEALSVGDFLFQQKCAQYMRETLSGVTKILVSHDLAAISSMADRVLVLDKGEVKFIGDTQTGLAVYQKVARASLECSGFQTDQIKAVDDKYEPNDYAEEWIDIDQDQQSGTGRVIIHRACWVVNGKASAKTIKKGESLFLEFLIETKAKLDSPIVGYQIQDRFGAAIFGDNTASSLFDIQLLLPGNYRVVVQFIWPQVAPGEYGVTLGVGNGFDSTAHVVECWAHNVIVLGSVQTDPVHGVFNNKINEFSIRSIG